MRICYGVTDPSVTWHFTLSNSDNGILQRLCRNPSCSTFLLIPFQEAFRFLKQQLKERRPL